MNNDFTALSDADLQSLADECKAQADKCYLKARQWSKRGGEHVQRLRRVSQEIMRRKGWLKT